MPKNELKKVISPWAIFLITINAIMGTGIFFLVAVGAKVAGPASILAWIIIGLISIYISMIFAELTSMFPTAGGVYEFCKNAYNSFGAFIIGWITFLTGNITITMLVIGAIQYLAPQAGWLFKSVSAMIFIIVFHAVAYFGMKTSTTMLIAFAFITLTSVLIVVFPAIPQIQAGNLVPFFVTPKSALVIAIILIAETFFGWETATFLAGETKNGERTVPRALVWGTVLIAVISLVLAVTAMGAVPWQELAASDAPLTVLANVTYGSSFNIVITFLIYLSMIGSVAGWIIAAPRLILSMAEDKLFISQLAKIHPKYSTPYRAIIFQAVFVTILVFISSATYEAVLHLLLPLAVVQYSAVAFALIILRKKHPKRHRPFKAPAGKTGAIAVIAILWFIIGYWIITDASAFQSLKLAASITMLGIPFYFLLKVYYDPDTIIKLNDMFAFIAYVTEKISLPHNVKKEILLLLGDIRGKTVLEFGCSIGTLTIELAEKVSSSGKLFATNISAKELQISRRRISNKGHQHVVFIHDMHQTNRIHPMIPQVDAIVSFGMLTYIQDVKKVMAEMSDIIQENGRIVLVDWVNFFHVIPDVEWLTHDDFIREIFREVGFSVTITRKKGLFWDYLYIHGIKSKNTMLYV
ncbi:MAG: amino acid permease [Nanoarchaeota archaeon]